MKLYHGKKSYDDERACVDKTDRVMEMIDEMNVKSAARRVNISQNIIDKGETYNYLS